MSSRKNTINPYGWSQQNNSIVYCIKMNNKIILLRPYTNGNNTNNNINISNDSFNLFNSHDNSNSIAINNSKVSNDDTINDSNNGLYKNNEINNIDNFNTIYCPYAFNIFNKFDEPNYLKTNDIILETDNNYLFNDVNASGDYAAPFDGNNTTSINNSTNYPNSSTINFNSFNDVNTSVHNNNKASSGVKIINNKLNDDNRDIENIINCIEKFNETNLLKEFYKPKNDELIRIIKLYGKKEKEENINNNKAIKDDVNKIPKKVVGKSEISIKARKKDLNNFFENKIQFFSYIFYNNESGKGCSNNDRHKKCEEIIVNEDNIIKAIINYDLPGIKYMYKKTVQITKEGYYITPSEKYRINEEGNESKKIDDVEMLTNFGSKNITILSFRDEKDRERAIVYLYVLEAKEFRRFTEKLENTQKYEILCNYIEENSSEPISDSIINVLNEKNEKEVKKYKLKEEEINKLKVDLRQLENKNYGSFKNTIFDCIKNKEKAKSILIYFFEKDGKDIYSESNKKIEIKIKIIRDFIKKYSSKIIDNSIIDTLKNKIVRMKLLEDEEIKSLQNAINTLKPKTYKNFENIIFNSVKNDEKSKKILIYYFDELWKNKYDNLNDENFDSQYTPLLNNYIPKSYNKNKIIITGDVMISESRCKSLNNKRRYDSVNESEDKNGNKKAKRDLREIR